MSSKNKPKKPVPSCAACHKIIQRGKNNAITCSNKDCGKIYHKHLCMGENPPADKWICPSCESAKKMEEDNSSSSGSSDNSEAHNLLNQASISPTQIQYLLSEINMLREDITDLKDQITIMKSSTISYSDKIDDLSVNIRQKLEQAALEKREEMASLKNEITQIRDLMEARIQMSLRNDIEIIGVPESPNEDLIETAVMIAAIIGIDLVVNDVNWVSRNGRKPTPLHNEPGLAVSRHPRPVVIRLLRRDKRDEFIKASKAKRNLTAEDLGLGDEMQKIYINERLSKFNRMLFLQAQRRSRQAGFKYCWTKNCSIYVRKRDGSSAIPIRTAKDLEIIMRRTSSSQRNSRIVEPL